MEEVLGSIPRRDHHSLFGELAQLAARFFSIEEVASSILALSIYFPENMGFLFKYMKCRFKLAMHTSSLVICPAGLKKILVTNLICVVDIE